MTVEEFQRAIGEYGRQLVPLPADAAGLIDVYPNSNDPDAGAQVDRKSLGAGS